LGGVNLSDIFDFCSFILGEEVSYENIINKRANIMELLNNQYPNMKRTLFLSNDDVINNELVRSIIDDYKKEYGDEIIIKSSKKDTIKSLNKVMF